MRKLPDYYVKDIFEIPIKFFKKIGVKTLLCDLDNTLDAYDVLSPSDRVINLKKELDENDIKLYIISNNTGERVSTYANKLGVKYLSSTGKPFGFKLKKYLLNEGLSLNECALVGDQLVTDIPCAKRAGIIAILTDPIVSRDQWTTRFNRKFDIPRRKRLIKKGIISHMKEEDYGQ